MQRPTQAVRKNKTNPKKTRIWNVEKYPEDNKGIFLLSFKQDNGNMVYDNVPEDALVERTYYKEK